MVVLPPCKSPLYIITVVTLIQWLWKLFNKQGLKYLSSASCCVLKLKEASIDVDIFCCSARKKLDGSTGDVERFNKLLKQEWSHARRR